MSENAGAEDALSQNKEVVRRHLEKGVSEQDLSVYDTVMDENYVLHVGRERDVLAGGRKGYKAGLGLFQESFPDMRIELLDVIAEGDQVVAHYIERGTHSGRPFRGQPPSGRSYEKHGFGLYRIHDGRMIEGWVQEDEGAFLRDLGWGQPDSG